MLTTFIFTIPLFSALSVAGHEHARAINHKQVADWYQSDDHPVHALLARQDNFPVPGSAEWSAGYPASGNLEQIASLVPQEWKDILDTAVKAGKIPDIPPTTVAPNVEPVTPVYPAGTLGSDPKVCSTTVQCKNGQDIWEAPPGAVGTGFDDGPTAVGGPLYDFLGQNNISATHFMIGANVLNNPAMFARAYKELNNPIAGHSWSHRHHTSLTNLELLGEFGFTLKIVRDSTEGRVFKYWRPPYGDSDNRVAAVAREVFGLTAIMWNHDTDDWGLASGAHTFESIQGNMKTWLSASKSEPGPIILHHEHNPMAVQAFINGYPLMVENGWKIEAVSSLFGSSWQNADDNGNGLKTLAVAHTPEEGAAAASADSAPGSGSNTGTDAVSAGAPSASAAGAPSAPVGRPPRSTPAAPSVTVSANQLQQTGETAAAALARTASWSLAAAALVVVAL